MIAQCNEIIKTISTTGRFHTCTVGNQPEEHGLGGYGFGKCTGSGEKPVNTQSHSTNTTSNLVPATS